MKEEAKEGLENFKLCNFSKRNYSVQIGILPKAVCMLFSFSLRLEGHFKGSAEAGNRGGTAG